MSSRGGVDSRPRPRALVGPNSTFTPISSYWAGAFTVVHQPAQAIAMWTRTVCYRRYVSKLAFPYKHFEDRFT